MSSKKKLHLNRETIQGLKVRASVKIGIQLTSALQPVSVVQPPTDPYTVKPTCVVIVVG
jgi:hypothetical protein